MTIYSVHALVLYNIIDGFVYVCLQQSYTLVLSNRFFLCCDRVIYLRIVDIILASFNMTSSH